MREIKINGIIGNGKFAMVDDELYEYLNSFRWTMDYDGYAKACILNSKGKKSTIRMHSLVLSEKGMITDHKDQNKLNNQKYNLRTCTKSQNGMNRKKHTKYGGDLGTTSKYKGVSFHKTRKKWVCNIQFENIPVYMGYFDTEIEAAKAYNSKANELFGEFAFLNVFD